MMLAVVIFCWVVTVIVVFWLGMIFQAKNQPTDAVRFANIMHRYGVPDHVIEAAMIECGRSERHD